jgi:hypothetical protein
MSDYFSGKSGVFVFLLAVLVMIVSVAIKYVGMVSQTPANVSGELEEVFSRVEAVRPLSLQKAEFLMEWGRYRDSDECSEAVSASRTYSGSGFEGDIYVVTYTDSIEFPALPTLVRQFRIEKPMRHGN